MKRLSRYFFEGLLLLAPMAITVYVVVWIAEKIDRFNPTSIPGVGLLITISAITLIGFLASHYLAGAFMRALDSLFARLPFIKLLYTSIKDLMDAFVGDKKSFNRPVLVSLSAEGGVEVLGFITLDSLEHLDMPGKVAVYLPQSYNFAGNLIIVRKERVTPVNASSGKVMALIVSGGFSSGNDRQ